MKQLSACTQGQIDWAQYGYLRAFANWALRDEDPEGAAKTLAAWDAETLVKRLLAAGVENFTIDARSQWSAHYPSNVFRQAPILNGRDIWGELLQVADKHGLKMVAYLPTGEASTVTVENPDWAIQNPAGQPLEYGTTGFYRACSNSGYRQFEIECQLELLEKYPSIVGLWYDGPGYCSDCRGDFYCYCPSCRRLFEQTYGYAIPEQPAWGTPQWADYIKWRVQNSVDVTREYYEAVKKLRPDIAITANVGFIGWPGPGEEVCQWVDQIGLEIDFYDSMYALAFMKSAGRGKPVEVYIHSKPRGVVVGLAEAEVRYQAQLTMAQGAIPNFTWGNDDVLRRTYRHINDCMDGVKDTRQLKWCGLVHSQASRYLHDQTVWAHRYKFENYGQYAMLLDDHVPTSFVFDEDMRMGGLDDYAVLVLADTAVMDDQTAENVERFVRNGGGLVVTGYTSLRDEMGRQRDDFLLADIMGVRYAGGDVPTNVESSTGYEFPLADSGASQLEWRFCDHEVWRDAAIQAAVCPRQHGPNIIADTLTCRGRLVPVKACEGIDVLATSGQSPLVTMRKHGKGMVAYVACDIGSTYRDMPMAWMHRFFGRLVRHVARGACPVEIDAPSYCKATVFSQEDKLIVHLLSDPNPFGRWPNVLGNSRFIREDTYPVSDCRVRVTGQISNAVCLPDRRSLEILHRDGIAELNIPEFNDHVVLILRGGRGLSA